LTVKCPNCGRENVEDSRFCSSCATPLHTPPDQTIPAPYTVYTTKVEIPRGTIFAGRYEILEELGSGGMGRVFKVYDQKIKEVVALKMIKPEIAANERTIERFSNEIRYSRKISHRNVCRMYDLGHEGPVPYITMEYIPGEDLKSFIRRSGQLTVGKAVRIAKQVAEGLIEAHRLGIVHRDLKPTNIMIDKDGNAKIMDFGIARSLHVEGVTASGTMIGTPEYMSPEQAEFSNVDERSDIYSLGILLYEMLTEQTPFQGETPLGVALKHKTETPRAPREYNAHISLDLNAVILKCLEKDRDKRFQKAEELRESLDLIEQGLPTIEREIPKRDPITSKEITVTFRLKKLLAPALILILAGAATIVWLTNRSQDRPDETTARRAVTSVVRGKEIPVPQDLTVEQKTEMAEKMAARSKDIGLMMFGNFLGQSVSKIISEEDLKSLQDANLYVEKIKGLLPEDSPYLKIIAQVQDKIQEGSKLQKEGKTAEAQERYAEGQSQMQDLMAQVRAKQQADRTRMRALGSKAKAEVELRDREENFLFKWAEKAESDALKAYESEDFSGAETMFEIAEIIYAISTQARRTSDGVLQLQLIVRNLETEALSVRADERAEWLYATASAALEKGKELQKAEKYDLAAEKYIEAAYLYKKAVDESGQTRRRPGRDGR
jgi:serine/threonine protein kinase